ncbi:MAG TPA: fumarylacetoacetate hydrolase family protein [Candidatus Sulfomarinibacteraceae bacterium]|nr:fumarylacetoacetate hydrolase family protein [Candidatus Sulfomarinibacteraceae bacterium]
MRLVAFLGPDGPAVGLATPADRVIRLTSVDGGLDLALAEERLPELLAEAAGLAARIAAEPDAGEVRADLQLLPAVEFPGKVVCLGLNYADHVKEGGRPAPPRPVLFSKFANAVVGDGEPIIRPEGTHALDLEVELGVVIGRRARRVTATRAMDHVAGYVVVNDVSARDWQGIGVALHEGEKGDGQWLRAKGSDTFLPVGADFVTPDEVDPAAGLRIRSWRIPGSGPEAGTPVLMQDATTADMMWRVPEVIEYICRQITLEPGDIIATGTPSGVGVYRDPPVFLAPGDRVRCQVDGIGTVENPVIDWSAVPDDEDDGPD